MFDIFLNYLKLILNKNLMIPYKLITNHCFLTIQQNNKTDTESKNSLIWNYYKIGDYYKMRLTNKNG